jgi:hypothetical protein
VAAVQVEANYYAGLAQEISDQVARLRRIASEGEQIGKTAEKLRSSAGDTADKLAQTHGRVQSVGSALTAWVPHLQAAQDDTLAALRDAQNAQAEQQANHPPAAGSPPPTSDADKQAAASRAQRYSEASAGLAAARRRFEDAIAERDRQASGLAGQIRDALHDGLKDGFWDHISNWVSQHIGMIKMVVTVLTWVATAVAIACIFIPGLNILAIALTVGLLAAHTLHRHPRNESPRGHRRRGGRDSEPGPLWLHVGRRRRRRRRRGRSDRRRRRGRRIGCALLRAGR